MTDRLTDRQTDHATASVTINRIYVHSTAMRPNSSKIYLYRAVESIDKLIEALMAAQIN